MKNYLELMNEILVTGEIREDRTGTGTHSLFGPQLTFDLRYGFPAITTKKLQWNSVVAELDWFLRGETNVNTLHPCRIWDAWANASGDCGPIYGKQWRNWEPGAVDQIGNVIKQIKIDPFGRRHIVSAWNVSDIDQMKLPPCHVMFQFYVSNSLAYLDCKMYQRSADYFIGVPFNIASYALLLTRVAREVSLVPRRLIITFGDVHIYFNHVAQCHTQLSRTPLPLPTLSSNEKLINYQYLDALPGEINV